MTKEVWKNIPGYEGKYQASNLGRIKSLERQVRGVCYHTGNEFYRTVKERILRPGKYDKSGHVSVVLGHGQSSSPVHQLVAEAFLGKCPNGQEVLHVNGNPTDNRIENLRYGTRIENILDVYHQGKQWKKLSIEDVYNIRFHFLCGFNGKEISKIFGVSENCISQVKNRRTFSWLQ